jgi:hypothetical protein
VNVAKGRRGDGLRRVGQKFVFEILVNQSATDRQIQQPS